MRELEIVALDEDLPEFDLKAGDLGTIVQRLGGGSALMVEFVTLEDETVAVPTLRPDQIRPIGDRP